ncbi:hypothetical protein ALC62_10535, partial [Cyphomyrmex costatus]
VHMKICYLYNLNFFPDNMGDFSDVHGERFYQDIATIQQRFKERFSTHIHRAHVPSEYCSIYHGTQDRHKHQTKLNKNVRTFGCLSEIITP